MEVDVVASCVIRSLCVFRLISF